MVRRSLLILGLISALLAACSSTPVATPAPPTPVAPAPAAAPPAPAPKAAPAPVAVSRIVPLHLDPSSALSREHSVFFDFDSSIIGSDYAGVTERHGHYLAQQGNLKVTVQGNTDERGGSEYNLALGQRRAEAVKSALKLMGAKDAQIEAVSFGKEKPVAMGHDEAAWRQNRRADIVYLK
ncbi:peptidoglycan-associated lipoprotein Pal [Paucibacter sediminis]|uniref:Peptidoglycan-associated lipoprotein n=1 Tax=Paucibacter sediminis TaxID=3019553 RepID=A0AA95NG32_9BURK|nr:peptidoglycan-associated lipoprotein Pal [Paucibacter sp. S2-9]WIT14442.1 peptidoglycan-associated lipoprotein Pal [Paucibacter sp. S2-9]